MKKNILVLTPRFPWPLVGGDKIRIYHIAKGLKEAGHDLALFSLVENGAEAQMAELPEITSVFSSVRTTVLPKWRSYLNTLKGIVAGRSLQASYYHSPKFARMVAKDLSQNSYDTVLVHLARMATYVMDYKGAKKVLEMTDAVSLIYKQSRSKGARGFLGKVYAVEENRALDLEKKCVKNFDVNVVVSKRDRDYLLEQTGVWAKDKVVIVRHGVQDKFFIEPVRKYQSNLIVFVGNLRTHQNNDAVIYFAKEIYPLVQRKVPDAIFRVIGSNPSSAVRRLNKIKGIEVTGAVSDVIDHIKNACVSVAPIRIGAGVQGKILESMAAGVPVVTTSLSAKGIEQGRAGEHFLVGDTPQEFSSAIVKIMKNKDKRATLSRLGKELAEQYRYSDIRREYAELFS